MKSGYSLVFSIVRGMVHFQGLVSGVPVFFQALTFMKQGVGQGSSAWFARVIRLCVSFFRNISVERVFVFEAGYRGGLS